MPPTDRRSKDQAKKRYSDAKETAQKQQQGFIPAFVALPPGVKSFRFKAAKNYRLVVIPFETKKGNPNCDPGIFHWERTVWTHGNIGPEEQMYPCLSKVYGEPCPVDEETGRLREIGGDAKLIESLEKLGKRQIIALFDLDDAVKGVQVYDGPYRNGLGELIDNKVDLSRDGSPTRRFFYEECPQLLTVKVIQDSFNGRTYFKPVAIDMEALEPGVVPAHLYEKMFCLDDCVLHPSYDELHSILHKGASIRAAEAGHAGTNGDQPQEPDPTIGGGPDNYQDDDRTAKAKGIEPGTAVIHDNHGECTVIKLAMKNGVEMAQIKTEAGKLVVVPVNEIDLPADQAPPAGNEPDPFADDTLGWEVGETVSFDKKGKEYTGTIETVNIDKQIVQVKVDGLRGLATIDFADLRRPEPAAEDDPFAGGNDADPFAGDGDDFGGGEAGGDQTSATDFDNWDVPADDPKPEPKKTAGKKPATTKKK